MVRAKFTVVQHLPHVSGEPPEYQGATVTLSPVVGGSPENDDFYKWTPGGSIVLSTINENAANKFEVGKSYYVDFSPAD